jgi:glycosyltransferase involved in cell wall biosynthesis
LEKIDVILLTKNSQHLLTRCLNSVFQNVPVNKLIVVDGYSTDATVDILLKFKRKFGNVSIYHMHGTRAKAREEGISHVRTEWFLFVDSDAMLCTDWYHKAKQNMTEGVGAIWGLNFDVIPNIKDKRIVLLQSLIARQCFYLRGGTHDTLVRTKAVDGMHIPKELHAYEDHYILKFIRKGGFKVVVGDKIYCLHYKPPTNWSPQNAIDQAIVEFKCGWIYSHMFWYSFFYPVFMFYWLLQVPLSGFGGKLKSTL